MHHILILFAFHLGFNFWIIALRWIIVAVHISSSLFFFIFTKTLNWIWMNNTINKCVIFINFNRVMDDTFSRQNSNCDQTIFTKLMRDHTCWMEFIKVTTPRAHSALEMKDLATSTKATKLFRSSLDSSARSCIQLIDRLIEVIPFPQLSADLFGYWLLARHFSIERWPTEKDVRIVLI